MQNTEQVFVPQIRKSLYVRSEKRGDLDVIGEVLSGDCYNLRELAKRFTPKVVVDVGAHIGTFSCFARTLWPDALTFSFEPVPRSYEILCMNLGLFQYPQKMYWAFNGAVRYDESTRFADGLTATGGGFVMGPERSDNITNEYEMLGNVPTFRIEQGLAVGGVDHVDLLKLDCEGSEFDIIPHMPAVLREGVQHIVGEYHHERGYEAIHELVSEYFPHLKCTGGNGSSVGPFFAD